MPLNDYKQLVVWQRAFELAKLVHQAAASFPPAERFELASQVRRCAVSIPSNVAEGACRDSKREYLRFISIARGSLAELETQLLLARDFGYLASDAQQIFDLLAAVGRLLRALRRSLQEKLVNASTPPLHHSTTVAPKERRT